MQGASIVTSLFEV